MPLEPEGEFALWYSVIFRPGAGPDFKVYLNPTATGADRGWEVVATALERLGLGHVVDHLLRHARPRGDRDRPSFFALDLHDRPDARVKVYVSHEDAGVEAPIAACRGLPGADPGAVAEFGDTLTDGQDWAGDRPLIPSFTHPGGP